MESLKCEWNLELPCFLFTSPLQIHCISTEFTPRKKGGEKGVPFRLQVDTFKPSDKELLPEHLHSAGCLIKVFKVQAAPEALPPPSQGCHPALLTVWMLCYRPSACGPVSGTLCFSVRRGMGLDLFHTAPSVMRSDRIKRVPLRFPSLPSVAQRG